MLASLEACGKKLDLLTHKSGTLFAKLAKKKCGSQMAVQKRDALVAIGHAAFHHFG